MAEPHEDLAELLADLEGMPDGLNIYAAPQESITAPAVVVKPDPLWISPDRFCKDLERYNVVATVTANTPSEGVTLLRSMMLLIIDALPSPWKWTQVDGPVIDQSTGVPFLAARLRLEYKNGGPE